MKCLRCGNTDPVYFYQDQDVWYCRKCIAFGRVNVTELLPRKQYQRKRHTCHPQLKYPLTPAQKKASDELRRNLTLKQDSLVFACCGAGKTEIVMEAIADYLAMGKKVGFAISRRQVVLEIAERMQEAFPSLSVIAVCEGYTDIVDGDLIICTMHQLYRYHQTFDLLIMDEVDAFPYRGNAILKAIAMHACVGEKIYLTATPDDEMRKEVSAHHLNMVELFQRPHGYPLIVPEVKRGYSWMQITYLLLFLKSQRKAKIQTLVFVPTIRIAHRLTRFLSLKYACCAFTSKTENKEKIIKEFHEGAYEFLVATTVLERGITIKGIYVVILFADHPVFNEASLIQMIGRVGRSIEMPTGKGLFLCKRKTKDITQCITSLRKMNEGG